MTVDPQPHARPTVLVIDFGSQYTQLITRRIRELNVYSVSMPAGVSLDKIKAVHPAFIILSGGPNSVHIEGSPTVPDLFFEYTSEEKIPVLGICYGMQLIIKVLGGEVERADAQEYGRMEMSVVRRDSTLFGHVEDSARQLVWMSHGDEAKKLPEGFHVVATSEQGTIVAVECESRKIFGLQYHPEVSHHNARFPATSVFMDKPGTASWSWCVIKLWLNDLPRIGMAEILPVMAGVCLKGLRTQQAFRDQLLLDAFPCAGDPYAPGNGDSAAAGAGCCRGGTRLEDGRHPQRGSGGHQGTGAFLTLNSTP